MRRTSDGTTGEQSGEVERPTLQPSEGSRVTLGDDAGHLALLVDGVVQSVAVDGTPLPESYWQAMVPDARPGSVLLLGLGAGTIARLLTERFGPVPIVGVELDPEIVALGRAHFGLDLPNLEVVVADAFGFVAGCSDTRDRTFDLIEVDLYDGLQLARGALAKPFLKQLHGLLAPGGAALFNLTMNRRLPRQLHRLSQVFRVTRTVDAGLNLVVRCTRG
jgi:spermidine synthase